MQSASAERLVEQDPLGESGWRLLMRGYFDNGDRSHALQAFKRCQQALRDELDVDPEADNDRTARSDRQRREQTHSRGYLPSQHKLPD